MSSVKRRKSGLSAGTSAKIWRNSCCLSREGMRRSIQGRRGKRRFGGCGFPCRRKAGAPRKNWIGSSEDWLRCCRPEWATREDGSAASVKGCNRQALPPPKDGKRQVLAVPWSVAEKLPRLESVTVISVTAPGRPQASLDGFKQVLRLSFADVEFMNPELSARAKEKLKDAFRPEHAETIREFAGGLPGEVATVVVHCDGGYSRSRDCAEATSAVWLRDSCKASSRS